MRNMNVCVALNRGGYPKPQSFLKWICSQVTAIFYHESNYAATLFLSICHLTLCQTAWILVSILVITNEHINYGTAGLCAMWVNHMAGRVENIMLKPRRETSKEVPHIERLQQNNMNCKILFKNWRSPFNLSSCPKDEVVGPKQGLSRANMLHKYAFSFAWIVYCFISLDEMHVPFMNPAEQRAVYHTQQTKGCVTIRHVYWGIWGKEGIITTTQMEWQSMQLKTNCT